jgi:hypothetical protein
MHLKFHQRTAYCGFEAKKGEITSIVGYTTCPSCKEHLALHRQAVEDAGFKRVKYLPGKGVA